MKSMFDPLTIGALVAGNSVVRSATAESLATSAGCPTNELLQMYEELACGGVGTIITGYAYIASDGKPSEGALGIYDDAFADDYRKLVEAVHAHGARIVLQLVYGGSKSKLAPDDPRRVVPAGEGSGDGAPNVTILGPSSFRNPKTGLVPTEATSDDLERIVRAFGEAAARAKGYGFDGIEIHAAHGYLLCQFLSRRFNTRTDSYGGALENRARLALECVRAARNATGPDYPIFVKVNSCDDFADPEGAHGGLGEDESALVCEWLADAGASAIDVSGDWHAVSGVEITGEPFFGRFGTRLAAKLGNPVIVTGGWRSVDAIERHLRDDGIAGIAMSRPFICEPDLVARWRSGDTSPSRCTACGYCAKHVGVPCAFADRAGS